MSETIMEVAQDAPLPAGMKQGAGVAVTAWSPIYADYDDPTMTAEYRAALFPVVLMVVRWDGRVGFPFGFVEAGASVLDTAAKEAGEEVGFAVAPGQVAHVATHQTEKIRVHLYALDLGVVPRARLAEILAAAARAEHCVSEGSAVWAHLADYGWGKGFGILRGSNALATAVGEEFDAVRARMLASAPPGAHAP